MLAATVSAAMFGAAGRAVVASQACGKDRWDVKTLSDAAAKDVSHKATTTTVDELIGKTEPEHVPGDVPRQHDFGEVEFSSYRVTAHLDGWKISADDSDIHLVILDADSRESMIVEFPDTACIPAGASDKDRARIEKARAAIVEACSSVKLSTTFRRLLGTATITGVGFFDKKHHQTGLADNGIELHPAMAFKSSNCRAG